MASGGTARAVAGVSRGHFSRYRLDGFFDEMFSEPNQVRSHYRILRQLFDRLGREDLDRCRETAEITFLNQGITFTVYNDSQGTERIFPFDLVPRVIPAQEWRRIEAGLTQRITALNLFLHDIYHNQPGIYPRSSSPIGGEGGQ